MKKSTIISANTTSFFPNLKELLSYKDLFFTLAWRDFKVRYAQTTIGVLWAFIQPITYLTILSLVFNRFVEIDTDIPHILFTATGISLWSYFAYVLTNSGNSIISNQGMVKKIYFPRLIIPLSKAIVGLIDLGIALAIMIVLMIYFQVAPSANIWAAPIFILIGLLAALSVGIWLSALTIRFRDFQHIVPFIVQLGFFITPIAYPADMITKDFPSWFSTIYYLNPMTGVIQGFRWAMFGGDSPSHLIWISFSVIIVLFITSLMYFRKVEDNMADYV